MKSLRFLAVVVVAFGLIMSGCEKSEPLSPLQTADEPGHSLAKPVVVHVSGTVYVEPGGEPKKEWFSDDIRHIRGWPIVLTLEGDLAGTGIFTQNSSYNSEGNGVIWGPATLDVECTTNGVLESTSGTFSGKFHAKLQEYIMTGVGVLRGSGGFEGMRFHVTLEGFIGGPYKYTGYISGSPRIS